MLLLKIFSAEFLYKHLIKTFFLPNQVLFNM